MATTTTIGDLILKLKLKGDKDTVSGLNNVIKKMDSLNKSVNKNTSSGKSFNGMLSNMVKGFTALGVVSSVVSVFSKLGDILKAGISDGIKYNTTMEQLNASMTALTGSQKIANQLQKEIVELSAESPYNIEGLSTATKTLLGYGVAQEDVMESMSMLGDIALGNESSFSRLALAFGQVTAKGKLQAEEVRQMVNAGFNPLQVIADKTGKTIAELTAEMKAGKITTEMVTDAMRDATSEGGRFYGTMDALTNTFAGQKEKIKEYQTIFYGNFIKPFQDFLGSKVLPIIADHMKDLADESEILGQKAFDATKELWKFIEPLYEIVKVNYKDWIQTGITYTKSFYNYMKRLAKLIPSLDELKDSLKNLIPEDLIPGLKDTKKVAQQLNDVLVSIGNWITDSLIPGIISLKDEFKKASEWISNGLINVYNNLLNIIANLDWSQAEQSIDRLKDSLSNLWENTKEPLGKLLIILGTALPLAWGVIEGVIKSIPNIIAIVVDAVNILASFLDGIFAVLSGDFKGFHDAVDSFFSSIWDIIVQFAYIVGQIFEEMVENVTNYFLSFGVDFKKISKDLNDYFINKWENMKTRVKEIASNIGSWLATKWDNIKSTVSTKVKDLVDAISNNWQKASDKMQEINDKVKNKIDKVKQYMKDAKTFITKILPIAFQIMVSTALNKLSGFRTKIKNKMSSAWEYLKNLKNSAYTWGKNLMSQFISGISSKIQALKNKVSSVASTVKDFVGWQSPTKEGAGKDSDDWSPNLMQMLIDGIEKYKTKIANATSAISTTIADNLSGSNTLTNVSSIIDSNTSVAGATKASTLMNVAISAESYDGEAIGRALIRVLNEKGLLTHKI